MGVQAVFVVLLMFASAVKTDEGPVEFWRNSVTLTCPRNGTWYDNKGPVGVGEKLQAEYKHELKYRCEYIQNDTNKQYFFYVKGRACENCFELKVPYVVLAIIVDGIGTVVVMIIIYKYSKKRSSDGPADASKPTLPSRSRPQTSQQSTYQELQLHTRDTYASVDRIG